MPKPPAYIAAHLRRVLKDGASAPHALEVQRFFKEEVTSRGWRAPELRKLARRFTKVLLNEAGFDYLVEVANLLFQGEVLEEKGLAVLLLETATAQFTPKNFKLFETWLDRISTWADHDALVHYLISPMVKADSRYLDPVFRWARSKDVWHRRAAAVALIRNAREKRSHQEIEKLTHLLLADQEDMVQKGLGWLLREAAKADPKWAVPFLMTIRERAPRLVLRTACEKLSATEKNRILALSGRPKAHAAPA